MSVLDEALRGQRIVVSFPAGGVTEWVAAAEVLLLEGFRTWVLPITLVDLLPEVLALYGRRARVGVGGLVDAGGVRAAVTGGAHFLTSVVSLPELRDAAGDVPLIPGVLTPQEIAATLRVGSDAVQVVPADVMGSAYARLLPAMFPGTDLMATGRLERYQAEMWLQAGARAVCVDGVILQPEGGTATVNDAADVRRRCQTYGQLLATVS